MYKSEEKMKIPTYDSLMNPLLLALHKLGGSGSNDEINMKVIELLDLPEDITEVPHGENGSRSEVEYRLAWARTYLKKFGILENSSRGIWSLSEVQESEPKVNSKEVVKFVQDLDKRNRLVQQDKKETDIIEVENDEDLQEWKDELKKTLLQLDPSQFERLAQRLLRESGFTQVEVTGQTGDGGIDGKGLIKIGGLISFHAMFQCKRYQGSVSSSHIRDFRGALQGRADKGLFITTGKFTRDAQMEAQRDGAPPIDLIDGDDLADKLKELDLGIKTELIEKVSINHNWFMKI